MNDTGIKWSGGESSNAETCSDNRQDCGHGTNSFSFSSTTTGGCVADSVTGLTWSPDQGTASWDGIASKASSANAGSGLCGKTDWRAATLKELLSIVSYNNMSSTPLVDSTIFSITLKTDKPYWSGTSTNDSTKAWGASFSSGWSSQLAKGDSYNVILVSGATSTPSFSVDNTAGTVTDNNTKLIWKKCLAGYSGTDCATAGDKTTFTWAEALTYAASAGSGWRLPNLKELQSIVKEDSSPAVDASIFPNANFSVWSSSPHSKSASVAGATRWKAWAVEFSTGSFGEYFRDTVALYVRLVKDPTP